MYLYGSNQHSLGRGHFYHETFIFTNLVDHAFSNKTFIFTNLVDHAISNKTFIFTNLVDHAISNKTFIFTNLVDHAISNKTFIFTNLVDHATFQISSLLAKKKKKRFSADGQNIAQNCTTMRVVETTLYWTAASPRKKICNQSSVRKLRLQ